jgi:hypothetical protein
VNKKNERRDCERRAEERKTVEQKGKETIELRRERQVQIAKARKAVKDIQLVKSEEKCERSIKRT